jgi:alpha/beta superfamily hydrolase
MEQDGTTPHAPESLARHVTFQGRAVESGEAPTLEGRLSAPQDGALHPAVVICHANPAAGGHMDMKMLLAIESALVEAGFGTLRYNSRGVGDSEGAISRSGDRVLVAPEGAPETRDIGAALDFIAMQQGVDPNRLALVGHSFGSRVSLAYLASHPGETRVQAVVCIGLPVAWRNLAHLGQWECPKLFVTGEYDDFSPPDQLKEYVDRLPEPSTIVTLKGTGHFFEGRERDLANVVTGFLTRVFHQEEQG